MIDGHENSIVQEDVYGLPISDLNPHGNAFRVKQTPITKAGFADASPSTNRSFKIVSVSSKLDSLPLLDTSVSADHLQIRICISANANSRSTTQTWSTPSP